MLNFLGCFLYSLRLSITIGISRITFNEKYVLTVARINEIHFLYLDYLLLALYVLLKAKKVEICMCISFRKDFISILYNLRGVFLLK